MVQVKKKDDGEIYAMKILRKDAIIARKQVAHTKVVLISKECFDPNIPLYFVSQAEKSILQKIEHPFIVKLNYAFQTEDKLYMVLDYVNGGELFFHLKKEVCAIVQGKQSLTASSIQGKFSEERVRLYAAEIASALESLHERDIVYRDLKPENILLDDEGEVMDFA